MASLQERAENKAVRKRPLVGFMIIAGVAVLILLAIGGGSLVPPPWRYVIWIGVVLIPALSRFNQPLTYLSSKSRAGTTLLNLGHLNKRSGWDIAVLGFPH